MKNDENLTLSIELVLPINKKTEQIKKLLDMIMDGFYCNFTITILDDAANKNNKAFLEQYTKISHKIKVCKVLGNIEDSYNNIINNSNSDYLYFGLSNTVDFSRNFLKLPLEYAHCFNSDIVCFGISAKKNNLSISFLETISESKYAKSAIIKEAIRKNALLLLCNKIYKTKFLKINNIRFEKANSSDMIDMAFNIEAFLKAQKLQATGETLITFEKIEDIYEPMSVIAFKKYTVFLKGRVEKLKEYKPFVNEVFILIMLSISKRLCSLPTKGKFANEFLECLQEFVTDDSVQEFINIYDYEDVIINHFSNALYTKLIPLCDDVKLYFVNILKFHIFENLNCINEALLCLLRFVNNKTNKNKMGQKYLNDILKVMPEENVVEYNFIIEHNLEDQIANSSLKDCLQKIDALFNEGETEEKETVKILTVLALINYVSGNLFDALQIYRTVFYSYMNKDNLIPQAFLNLTRIYYPIESKIIDIFLQNKELLKFIKEDQFELLIKNLETFKDSCEKNIILARICVMLGALEDAVLFYKEALNDIRNTDKYPLQEVVSELEIHDRKDLLKMLK